MMMVLKPFYDPAWEVMRVAGFLSGTGSNIRNILEYQKKAKDPSYSIVVLFSDSASSNAANIGKEYDIPVVIRDIRGFYHTRKKKLSDQAVRTSFDMETIMALEPYRVSIVAYGGYMSIASHVLVHAFLGINVHPADLSIETDGKRTYCGAHAVRDALRAGEQQLRASTHIVTNEVDQGPILMISQPVAVIAGQTPEEHQHRLKEQGDWVIFPKTLEYLAQGRFASDEKGHLFFDGKPIPKGLRVEEMA